MSRVIVASTRAITVVELANRHITLLALSETTRQRYAELAAARGA